MSTKTDINNDNKNGSNNEIIDGNSLNLNVTSSNEIITPVALTSTVTASPPPMRIMKRNASSNTMGGSSNGLNQKKPVQSIEEKQISYQKARERIFGVTEQQPTTPAIDFDDNNNILSSSTYQKDTSYPIDSDISTNVYNNFNSSSYFNSDDINNKNYSSKANYNNYNNNNNNNNNNQTYFQYNVQQQIEILPFSDHNKMYIQTPPQPYQNFQNNNNYVPQHQFQNYHQQQNYYSIQQPLSSHHHHHHPPHHQHQPQNNYTQQNSYYTSQNFYNGTTNRYANGNVSHNNGTNNNKTR
ncbi:hypothetical protein DLAC_11746 [Tieghemostelium lacteum]|uniref:SUZ domain-containing protein n=1 Tax=Tieghemostelium lacteum TaxID=361077 RepID=A0A151Z8V4_TIELA|nr:hypothetical protein DLAC_11746 [Tieghemostelium lacteum]|eukprot:KYQ90254.1 hypothetical protein DLAC_11746 [Tieghemostelium lacteum]